MLDRKRFHKICEGLASANETERAVSAAKATGMLMAAGLTWGDVASSVPDARAVGGDTHFCGIAAGALIARIVEFKRALSPGDREFVAALAQSDREPALSRFQWAVLMRVAAQSGVLAGEGAP